MLIAVETILRHVLKVFKEEKKIYICFFVTDLIFFYFHKFVQNRNYLFLIFEKIEQKLYCIFVI